MAMKRFFRLAAFLGLLLASFWAASPASAACAGGTCYGIATGNWSTSGTWSTSSGGASCACTPGTGDNIVFDAGSSGKTFTIDTSFSIGNLTGTAATTAALTYNAVTLTVTGTNFTLLSSMTVTAASSSRITSFNPASGTLAVTTAGKSLGAVIVNGTAGTTVQLQDDLTFLAGGSLTLTQATFDANNHNITGGAFLSNNSNTRTITLGSGTHTLNAASGNVWDTTTTTGLTMTPNTASLVVSSTATAVRNFVTGGLNFQGSSLSLVNSGATPAVIAISGAGIIASLTMTAPLSVTFASATTFTITNAFTLAGTAYNNILDIATNATGGASAMISVASGTPTIAWAAIKGITFTGGATFSATNSFDLKGNSGITISGPAGGGGGKIIGG